MAVIESFLGKRVEIPENCLYDIQQGLWASIEMQRITFGLTQPALVLQGGIKDLDWLVSQGQMVQTGDAVIFAITGKILYLDTPVAGTLSYNPYVRTNTAHLAEDPYGTGWLFAVKPAGDPHLACGHLSSAAAYLENLKTSEGFKNPNGLKGGVSGICKAVYTGIGDQRIK